LHQHAAHVRIAARVDIDAEGGNRRVGDRLDLGDFLARVTLSIFNTA
jgi:hypothetical protein